MFTRCPQCKTVHPLNAGLLSSARGLVECGQCGRTFSALNFLFDESPAGEQQRPANGPDAALPVLGSEGETETGISPSGIVEPEYHEPTEQQPENQADVVSFITYSDEETEPETKIPPSENGEPASDEANGQQPTSEQDVTSPVADSDEQADTNISASENGEDENSQVGEQASTGKADAASPATEPESKIRTDADATPADNSKPENEGLESLESKLKRLAWPLATAALVLITVINIVWTFHEPLLGNPLISSWMKEAGWLQVEQKGLLKDPKQIQLISRDMHTHPTRSGILVLSLTFVNLASRNQVFPELEVTLLDASSQPVAQRRLQPMEYLRPGADTEAGLAADVFLPVLLELGDPGDQAVGFEIRFL